ncbi:FAD-binding oxidoreductase [Streptomyces sp. NBC_00536]|uniref:FAD-binding oxidoreductase n=1 Tax=Streptomyces sp. NBC_00536 TaxID=2975769 RepID=UPI002E81B442|nr:FAD-binding oxidoreductase [Streptomyces sp. NBC_00536]WUC82689.1 FAD-binding oxidoreductase [Streptomyces sp. NBC_00536]
MSLDRRHVLAGAAAAVLASVGASGPPGIRDGRRAADFAALARDLDGPVVLPGQRDYAEARRLFQPRYDAIAPGAVAYPAHPGDVATCLAFARRAAVAVVPRGGGHSYAGYSTGPGLVVDVGAMAGIETGTGEVRVGAGARLGDVNALLAERGVAVPTGLCPSVGIAGLALGGGLGVSSRAFGTTSDQLTGIRIVTPDGAVRDVDARTDPDLFWALRGGGGGNFGVVTEFRLRTRPAGDCAFAELHWPWPDSAALLRGWQRWLGTLADPFWSQVEFVAEPGTAPGPAAVRVLCLDGRRELEAQLSRLADEVGIRPRDSHVEVAGYGDTMRTLSGCREETRAQCHLPGRLPGHDPQGRLGRDDHAARSDFWPAAGLPEDAVTAALDGVRRYASAVPPGGLGVVQFDGVCGGAVGRVDPAATAFVHRGAGFLAQYLAYWPAGATPAEAGRHQAWLDGLWQRLRPWASGRAYQNYTDPKLGNWREAYYGGNLARLTEVKRAYDPGRLFDFPQAV